MLLQLLPALTATTFVLLTVTSYLSYTGGTLGTNATAEWYSDATFTTNVGSGNNLTLATPSDTTTYYVRFEGDCNTTTGVNVTVNIKDVSVAPTSASVDPQ